MGSSQLEAIKRSLLSEKNLKLKIIRIDSSPNEKSKNISCICSSSLIYRSEELKLLSSFSVCFDRQITMSFRPHSHFSLQAHSIIDVYVPQVAWTNDCGALSAITLSYDSLQNKCFVCRVFNVVCYSVWNLCFMRSRSL